MDDDDDPRPECSQSVLPQSRPGNSETLSGRKRRHEDCDSSSDDDVEIEVGRDRDSSSWEDQESSDDAKLKIDVPKRKILRKRYNKSPIRKSKEIVIPEDVLAECSKLLVMDQNLDAKAKSINWGTKQVKMVLRAIVQSEEMMIMLRNAGLATGEKQPQQEPKMTRAMTKKVVEAGGEVPFILPPATPVKDVNKELFCLFDEELNEEDNDPEYNPEVDANSDDDESMLTSEPSEVGTPCTQNTDSRLSLGSAVSTPTSSHRPTPEQFKRPFRTLFGDKHQASRTLDFDTEESQGRVYSTRSRVNISDKAMEELEQLFVPPDITPDMYEIPDENGNQEYVEFLKELYGGPEQVDDLDCEEDPEFVYCPDEADQEIKDPEELRNDKATKITKKEVADLMAELLDFANQNNDDDSSKKTTKRKKTPLPGDAIFEAVKEHTDNTADRERRLVGEEEERREVEETERSVPVLTESERHELGLQVQQHVQLLTQMSLLSSHNPHWKPVRAQADRMMSEVFAQSVSCQNSVAAQPNLLTSMAVVKQWDEEGSDPTVICKNKNSLKHRKKNRYFTLSPALMEFMSRQTVFYFPLLLPAMALSQDEGRILWTSSEDQLLAFAMREAVPLARKPGLRELSFAVQRRFMKPKSAKQIKDRIRNLKLREEENPVVKFINHGECEVRPLQHTWAEVGNGCKNMLEMFVSSLTSQDFPDLWVRQLKEIIIKKKMRSVRLILPSSAQAQLVNCSVELARAGPTLQSPASQPILCVDGNSTTPTSDTDTPKTNPQPEARSPIKKLVLSLSNFQKSPLKAASDRIIKKYTIISPHKRTGSYLLKSPLKKTLKIKPVPISPKPVTPSRAVPNLSVKNTPPGIDTNYSPKSPCLPSPCHDDGEGLNEVDTPTNNAKRKSRHQKETELTLALVGPLESPEERETRERKESTKIFQELLKDIEDSPEKKQRFTEIMSAASSEGTVQTYKHLSLLVPPESHIQELLLDLLSDGQAASVSKEVYLQHQQRQNMKNFILKLNLAYRHQPAYHARVLRELDSLCADPSLSLEALKVMAVKLFKHNQHLLDHFMLMVPGVEPPDGMLPSPEHIEFPDSDSDNSFVASDTETITLEKSPETFK